jgi:hypothetical protein
MKRRRARRLATGPLATGPLATKIRRVGRASRRCSLVISFLCAAALFGCTKPEAAAPSEAPTNARRRALPLEDYLPPTGLRLAVQLRPQALWNDPKLGPELHQLISSARLRAFAETTGVELDQLSEAWLAEYELGKLYLVPYAHAATLGAEWMKRSESHGQEQAWSSTLHSYSLVRAHKPYGVVVDSGRFTALVEKDLTLGRLVVARALGKLDNVTPPLRRLGFDRFGPLGGSPLTVFWVGRPDLTSFSNSIDIGRAALFDEDGSLQIAVATSVLSEEDPLEDWRDYLQRLVERPEIRAVLGSGAGPEGLGCTSDEVAWICRAWLALDASAARARWGQLLEGGLDTF